MRRLITLSGKDGSLDSSSVSNSLIRIDGLVEGLSVEEVRKHGLDLWDSGRSTNKNDFVNLSLTNGGILEDVLDWRHVLSEKVHAELLELGSGDVGVVVLKDASIGKGQIHEIVLVGGSTRTPAWKP